jgi:hypothetical protein
MNTDASPLSDGQYGRRVGRALLVIALVTFGLEGFLFVAAPGFMEPMFGPTGIWRYAGLALVGLAVLTQFGAFYVMLRIHRANPEPDHRNWRYRSRR